MKELNEMNLKRFAERLTQLDPDAPLVFTVQEQEISAGYHVTEFKSAQITSIDCGANLRRWQGASLQLLDGAGDAHMSVSRFLTIAAQSIKALPELEDARLRIEFALQNKGLEIFELGEVAERDGAVYAELVPSRAQCKPLIESLSAVSTQLSSECCASATGSKCC